FGDSYKAPQKESGTGLAIESSAKKKGRTIAITTKDMQKRRNDVKARTTLLLALFDEHQLRFSKYKTAQELWGAILKTFDCSETLEQTFNRLQAIVSHLEFMNVKIEQDDLNQKLLTSLALEWLMYIIVWRNRGDLDTMSLDDLYNHLKVYEPEVQKKSESNSQNMAFISSAKNSSGKGKVNTASIPTASTHVSPASADVAAARKFDAKGDEGYFVRYSMSSKAFRVFNKRTKKVEENLHVDFLENKLIEKRAGPNWLFDIDTLPNSMNYVPVVVAGTSSINFSGTKDAASQGVKKDVSSLRYTAFPNCGNFSPTATSKSPPAKQMESLTVEFAIPTSSLPVPTACLEISPETTSGSRLISKRVTSQDETPSLENISTLLNRNIFYYFSGTKDAASQCVKKDVSSLRYTAFPNWFHEAHIESSNSDAQDA
nr:ribonuclease H-like domain-containing protein [Tanacetum cinerariifolium]